MGKMTFRHLNPSFLQPERAMALGLGFCVIVALQLSVFYRNISPLVPNRSHQQIACPIKLEVLWVVVKIMVPFWVPIIIRPLIFRVPQKRARILTTTLMFFLRKVGQLMGSPKLYSQNLTFRPARNPNLSRKLAPSPKI